MTTLKRLHGIPFIALLGLISILAGCETMPVPGPGPGPSTTKRLIVGSLNNLAGISSFAHDANLNGNVAPVSTVVVAASGVNGIAVNSAGQLVVMSDGGGAQTTGRISVFANAAGLTADQTPIRTVTGPDTKINKLGTSAMTLDSARDIVYCGFDNETIEVFDGTTTAAFDGNLSSARTITCTSFKSLSDMQVTPGNDLYVANFEFISFSDSNGQVFVLAGASGLNGAVTPSRTLTRPVMAGNDKVRSVGPLFIDTTDTLYLVESRHDNRKFIGRYPGATSLSGDITPAAMIEIPDTALHAYQALRIDSDGVGYLSRVMGNVNQQTSAIMIFENIAGLSGVHAPTRELSGQATKMNNPTCIAVAE